MNKKYVMKKSVLAVLVVLLFLVACDKKVPSNNGEINGTTTKEQIINDSTENGTSGEKATTAQKSEETTVDKELENFETIFLGEHYFNFDIDGDGTDEKVGFEVTKDESDMLGIYEITSIVVRGDKKIYQSDKKDIGYMYQLGHTLSAYVIEYNEKNTLMLHSSFKIQVGVHQSYEILAFDENNNFTVVKTDEVVLDTASVGDISPVEKWISYYNQINQYVKDDSVICYNFDYEQCVYSEGESIIYGIDRNPKDVYESCFWWIEDESKYDDLSFEERMRVYYDELMKRKGE